MATFADMMQTDPQIRYEYDVWRPLREQKGEDPVDWDAFRKHLVAIGHSDPGDVPPDDWVGEDYKQAHPEWWAQYTARKGNTEMGSSGAGADVGRAWRSQ